eukprot:CAMPEP_0195054966 /NCGR_PEP_ID=MMETSP0448-20130528/3718_1 /TAXON_ID=66468 /ORGANISM="Heterocapsa triquestra, Strain CCMP 448" /LENGTH=59 /DNA_ID=CAMNT_0040084535 /DNA_START=17 /DNA_END=193 /DNA_ORIENTATION=-
MTGSALHQSPAWVGQSLLELGPPLPAHELEKPWQVSRGRFCGTEHPSLRALAPWMHRQQ